MSKASQRLFDALNNISDQYIDQSAVQPAKPKPFPHRWRHWGTAAACVTLALMTVSFFPHLGGCGASGGEGKPESAPNQSATDFMSYAGPILPLTLKTPEADLSAERTVTLNFEAEELQVQDRYTLTNHSEEDCTVTVQLPFVTQLGRLEEPQLLLDGSPLPAALLPGGPGQTYTYESWQEIDGLLSDGSYRAAAAKPQAVTLNTPVTVYSFTDPHGPERSDEVPNPSIRADFDLDYDRTQVLSYGFQGGSFDREGGRMVRSFSIPRPQESTPQQRLLIVLGDDVAHLTVGGYITGGTDPDTPPLSSVSVTVTRKELSLGQALQTAHHCWQQLRDEPSPLSEEALYALFVQEYLSLFADSAEINRYGGFLEDVLSLVWDRQRICWMEAQITLPAGESCGLSAILKKEPSRNYGGNTDGPGHLLGYDLMPWLDSSLSFTAQTATLAHPESIQIVNQNFGFDLKAGITTVNLSPEVPHYYLEIIRASDLS